MTAKTARRWRGGSPGAPSAGGRSACDRSHSRTAPPCAYQSFSTRYRASRTCARLTGSTGISGGCGKALVDVLHDHPGVVEHEIPVEQRRRGVVGIQVEQVFGKLAVNDADDVDDDALLGEHYPGAMALLSTPDRNRASSPPAVPPVPEAIPVVGHLLHVLPDLLLEEIGEHAEDQQEGNDEHAQALTLQLHRLGDVVQEIHGVAHELVVGLG